MWQEVTNTETHSFTCSHMHTNTYLAFMAHYMGFTLCNQFKPVSLCLYNPRWSITEPARGVSLKSAQHLAGLPSLASDNHTECLAFVHSDKPLCQRALTLDLTCTVCDSWRNRHGSHSAECWTLCFSVNKASLLLGPISYLHLLLSAEPLNSCDCLKRSVEAITVQVSKLLLGKHFFI